MFLLNFYSQLCSFSLCSLYFHNFLHHSQFLFMFPATSAISTLSEHFFFLLGLPYRFSYNCLKYVSRHWFTAHSLIYTHTTTYIHTQLHTYTHTVTYIYTHSHINLYILTSEVRQKAHTIRNWNWYSSSSFGQFIKTLFERALWQILQEQKKKAEIA